MNTRVTLLLLSFLFSLGTVSAAVRGKQYKYTEKSPLVYEDSWSMWPYSFINDKGEPDGFNVELVRDVMRRLRIPLSIRLCTAQSAREDLHHDNANLYIGMKNGENASFGQFGRSVITTVSSGIITPAKDSLSGVSLIALEDMRFAVRKGSFAHHYLDRRGVYPMMIPMDNIDVVIREIAVRDSGAVVWSSASLAWLRDRYHLDNLAISPVDLPKEELHFMSNDENLLHRADSVLELIREDGTLAGLESKWFHEGDEYHNAGQLWSGVVIALAVIVVFIIIAQTLIYYYRRRMIHKLEDTIAQMQLTLSASHARVWVYDPFEHHFSWMNNKGETAENYTEQEFRRFYPDDQFDIILHHVRQFLDKHLTPVTVPLQGYSLSNPDEIIPLQVHMEAMRNEYKHIYLVVGVQHQVEEWL